MKLLKRDPDKGYLDSLLWIPKSQVNLEGTKKALTFTFMEQQNIVTLSLWKETEHHLLIPREFWDVKDLNFPVVDARPRSFTPTTLKSRIKLDFLSPQETTQQDAMKALLRARGGILQLACGKGKTVVALDFASRLGVPTIIIVDNTHLLGQWKKEILKHLSISPEEIGLIQGEVFDWQKPIVLATYQTLANRAEYFPEDARRWFGLVIWDEAHHVAAPTFAKTADLFYGYRLGLTATPTRDDGLHIIYDFHIGRVIFKDLRQELKPRIYFLWTGLEIDLDDSDVRLRACDKNGELHLSKLATYFGQWTERIELILAEVKKATDAGRKVLVLSNSVDELINMLAIWSNYKSLYTEVPLPIEKEVGELVPAMTLDKKDKLKIMRLLPQLRAQLRDPALNPVKRQHLAAKKVDLEHRLRMGEVADKVEAELRKRQRAYLKDLLENITTAGLMIHKVKPEERAEMLRTKQVVFAVSKYGREGLDEQALDTIVICEPFSSRNTLQQVMGRVLRKKAGKKHPVVIFMEDNIGPIIGMCQKLRAALRTWPTEENGPYDYEMLGHPARKGPGSWTTRNTLRAPGQ